MTTDVVAILLDDDMPPARLGDALRGARRRRGLKRRAAAGLVGITAEQLRAYERGEEGVPADVCARLAECYGDDLTAHIPLRVPVRVEDRWVVAGDRAKPIDAHATDDVLRTYVELLLRLRSAKPGEPVPLRATDLAALSAALGDDPADIEARIVELLGCTREEAAHLRSELLRRKLILPVAGLAAGAALLAAAGAGASNATPTPPTTTTTTVTAPFVHEVRVADVWDDVAPPTLPGEELPPPSGTPAPVPASASDPDPKPTGTAAPSPAPAPLTDATVPAHVQAPDAVVPEPDDPPVSIPPGEEFVEIGDAITEP